MSKSPNIFGPAIGVTGIVLGAAVAIPTMNARSDELEAANARAALAAERAAAAEAEIAVAVATAEEAAAVMPAAGAVGMVAMPAAAGREGGFGLGRPALQEEVAAWDIDVRPDGQGLPVGSGDVWMGEEVFIEKCAACHGDFGEAVGRWPVLAGGWDTLDSEDPVKTIGSYWPYLSTVHDYIYRAMPFGEAQSLTPDEVYAITAYLLYLNNIVEDDFELSNENFLEVPLPNEAGFFMDDRAETELALFSQEPCMEACKDGAEIAMRAAVLDVTPDSGVVTEASAAAVEEMAEAEEVPVEEVAAEAAEETPVGAAEAGAPAPELVAAGQAVFRKCSSCHQVGANASNRAGPMLNGIVGGPIGGVEGFRYSPVFTEANGAGEVWTVEALDAYLEDPRSAMAGTRMGFAGLSAPVDRAAVIAYLSTFE